MIWIRRTGIIIPVTLIILLRAIQVFCAPVGNIGDPGVWGEGLIFTDRGSSVFVGVQWDRQKSTLPDQQRMPTWNTPNNSVDEVRHYEQFRKSDNELSCSNITLGAVIGNMGSVYVMYGVCDSTIDLTYGDKTVAYGFSVKSTFQSDGDPFYGAGLSVIMHEGSLWGRIPVKTGLDIKYRRFDFEMDTLEKNGTFYAATLDEIQMALVISADTGFLKPYAGARISSTTGREHYMNENVPSPFYEKGFIDYEDDITWSKNIGYVIGASCSVKEIVSINVELRFGDEEALGCSASVRF